MYNGQFKASSSPGPQPVTTPAPTIKHRIKEWKSGWPFYRGQDLADYMTAGGLVKRLPSSARKSKKMHTSQGKVTVKMMKYVWLLNEKNFPKNALLVAPFTRNPASEYNRNSIANVKEIIAGRGLQYGTIVSNANIKDGFYKPGTLLKVVTVNEGMQTITEATLKLVPASSQIATTAMAEALMEIQSSTMKNTVSTAKSMDPFTLLSKEYSPSALFQAVGSIIEHGQNLSDHMGVWVKVNETSTTFQPGATQSVLEALQATNPEKLPFDSDIKVSSERNNKPKQTETSTTTKVMLGTIAAGIAGYFLL